ncbi:MAG: hypothetical protein IJK26_04390 [Clostridia bacterium]|nr:hypothetical protein [Clostridia bacterium]
MAEKDLKKRLRFSLSSLFNNNKFLLVFSFIVSFTLWLWVSVEKSPVVEEVIASVPVRIDLEDSIPSQLGLQVFGNTDYKVDVTVSGKKFIVSTLTADDIKVAAQTNYVDSAGNKTLTLKATNNSNKDFEIKALSQNYIAVYFDTLKESEFALEPNVLSDVEKLVIDECVLGEPILSRNTVSVSGPASEVNKITGAVATYTITKTLDTTTTVTPEIELSGAASLQVSNTTINVGETEITMTLPVLKTVNLPTTVTLKDAPAGYLAGNIGLSVYPASVNVGVPVEQLDQIKEISVGTVNFNEINSGNNTFKFSADSITDYKINDNVKNFRATVNVGDVTSATLSIPSANITISKQNDKFQSTVSSQSINSVRILGPAEEIAGLNAQEVFAELDLSTVELTEGTNSVPVKITVKGLSHCWAYGEYTAYVNSTAK